MCAVFGTGFTGFDDSFFDAFHERKWASNLYNIERLKVRDALRALGQGLWRSVSEGREMSWDVSTHVPTVFNGKKVDEMVLYFTRPEERQRQVLNILDRKLSLPEQLEDPLPHHKHVTLGVRVDHDGCEVGLMLHSRAWLDVMNLLNRCSVSFERNTFLSLLRALPSDMVLVHGPNARIPVREAAAETLEMLEHEVMQGPFLIFAGRRYSRDAQALRTASFKEEVKRTLLALMGVYDFVEWRPASDFLDVIEEQKQAMEAAKAGVASLSKGDMVEILEGVFASRRGTVLDVDRRGPVRVLVGKVVVRTQGTAVRLIEKSHE